MVTELKQAPKMLPLYLKAVAHKANLKNWQLPNTCLQLRSQRVDANKLARYRMLVGDERGVSTLPLAYPQVLSFPMQMALLTDKGFPFKVMGLVHLTNEITQHRPIDAAALFDLSVDFDGYSPHPKGVVFYVRTRLTLEGDDSPVWVGRAGYFYRNRKLADTSADWRDASIIGQDLIKTIDCNLKTTRAYAANSGDINPIHLSGPTAKLLGFKKPLAHGMWAMACAYAALPQQGAVQSEVRFMKPIFLPARIELFQQHNQNNNPFSLRSAKSGAVHMTGTIREEKTDEKTMDQASP